MKYPNSLYENKLIKQGFKTIAGVDEAGRGSWAGPIVAGAVVLPANIKIPDLKDSKMLSPITREKVYKIIIKKAICWSAEIISNKIIDKIGISQANLDVMNKAIKNLKKKPNYLLIDFLLKKKIKITNNIPYILIKKGDEKICSISAASIIAKVTRDRIMVSYEKKFPNYGFAKHKGYGTAYHRAMIKKYGICEIHRKSFKPMSNL
ncbi:MAG: ribonuclease HII [Patescibacteria group bacterium]|nr:ribonuclease HII [Patescibacteria group bacterium]